MIRWKKKNRVHSSIGEDSRRLLSEHTPFAVKEAFRSLYTNLLYLPTEGRCKKFAVASSYSGEGKTYISINLARTIAISSVESKVLLVDSDMRRPRLGEILKIGKTHGLSEYLASIDDYPQFNDTEFPNLKVLSSGAETINAMGLLTSSRMKSLIEILENEFDYVIFDTPPVNVVADALLLNDFIDGYIISTRADYSDVNSINDTLEAMEKINAHVLGFVLSAYDAKKSGAYGRYKYGSNGKYGKYSKYSRYSSY